MGFADELAKNTKSKQQIEAEKKAYQVKLENAWKTVLPEYVEYSALSLFVECSKATKRGEHYYKGPFPAPTLGRRSLPYLPLRIGDNTLYCKHDNQTYIDAAEYYKRSKGYNKSACFYEFKNALVARLKAEGLKVKVDNNTLTNLLFANNDVYITIKW